MMKYIAVFLSLCLSSTIVSADVSLPPLFTDHMILQQQTHNAVWGWADPNEKITITASWGESVTAQADKDGKWKVMLPTPKYSTDHTLTIKGKNTIKINGVAIGEVWLCAGQSNMGWALGQSFGGEEEAQSATNANYRIFKSAREHWHEPLDQSHDRLAKWSRCNPTSAASTSAVSYYFGRKLQKELDIPVGIIVQAYAGTPIEGWMPENIQQDDPRLIETVAQLKANSKRLESKGITIEAAKAQYDKDLKNYNAKIDRGETMKNKVRALKPPTIVKPSILGHQYPGHIYNAMINPIRPYGIRGAIWYQGERNSKNVPQATNYRNQLAKLIDFYRSSWYEQSEGNTDPNFPFYFTQLPSWNPAQTQPVEGLEASWAINREMMRLVSYDVPNSGVAVSIDTGDEVLLHPKNKKPIGIRLAYLALKQTYNKKFVDYGPRHTKQTIKGNKLILEFDSVGSGLATGKPGQLNSFAIAGKDQKWHWADASISGNTIILTSVNVMSPVAARYAWAMNPSQRNLLYNKEGIPASPFRTDDWPLFNENDEIVTVHKPSKPKGYQAKDWDRPEMTQ
ncbi:hypothetical protein JD969_03545 [Planctomycetota bacterium]|nr:hypothetical protein JD969_03545 [Planctomycetota bacterium]